MNHLFVIKMHGAIDIVVHQQLARIADSLNVGTRYLSGFAIITSRAFELAWPRLDFLRMTGVGPASFSIWMSMHLSSVELNNEGLVPSTKSNVLRSGSSAKRSSHTTAIAQSPVSYRVLSIVSRPRISLTMQPPDPFAATVMPIQYGSSWPWFSLSWTAHCLEVLCNTDHYG